MSLLTQTQQEQLQTIYDLISCISADGSTKVVGSREVFFILRSQGIVSVTESEVLDIVSECDTSGLGEVNFEEFCTLFARLLPAEKPPAEEILDAFQTISEGSKFVTKESMGKAIESLNIKINDNELREMIQEADVAENGKISRDDFGLMMSNRHKDVITDLGAV
ncbi:hypothetical protein ScalyP_jg3465 [Parmales sp. scaly parma]|nr:hypothetical protein ScalyP_jg3465 [Parmales sp. scaly parma]